MQNNEEPPKRRVKALTPYQRIVQAARRRVGVRLSAEEVAKLANDDAILTVAEHDDEDQGKPRQSRYV